MDFGVWQAMVSNPDSYLLPCDSGKLLSYKKWEDRARGRHSHGAWHKWGWINEKHHPDP